MTGSAAKRGITGAGTMQIMVIGGDDKTRGRVCEAIAGVAPEAAVAGYADAAAAREALEASAKARGKLAVRCFGYFDVFYGDDPLIFSRAKTKELLAYLVDREGAVCTGGEIELALWEDAGVVKDTKHYLRILTNDLRAVLASVGLEDVLIRRHNQWAVRRSLLDCDYYRMLDGKAGPDDVFDGEYMKQYSWAEETAARLEFREE